MNNNILKEGFIILLLVATVYQPTFAQPACIGGTDNDGIANNMDVDDDDDGLIEICTLDGLNAIRRELSGGSYKAKVTDAPITTGCPLVGSQEICEGYELINNLDFSESTAYGNWQPIGTEGTDESSFNAIFDGNNHTISNLNIDRASSDRLGLFGVVGARSHIRKVGLLNVDIKGNNFVGGLAGNNQGTIGNSYVAEANVQALLTVGGLVGENRGTIGNSYVAEANVQALLTVGGLVGENEGTIGNSYVAGTNVEAIYDSGSNGEHAGGLVGWNYRNIFNSYVTTGTVTGIGNVGGLVGNNNDGGNISNSYATATVEGTKDRDSSNIGGLVGLSEGKIPNGYATGTKDRDSSNIGGLVGLSEGKISNSYATGTVTGDSYIGGFVGLQKQFIDVSLIKNSYATGTVTGDDYIGGFVGSQEQSFDAPLIENSYAIGMVTAAGSNVGGFSGSSINIKDSYWDKTVNGALADAVDYSTSKTTAELRQTAIGEGIYSNWNANDWYGGVDYPVLKYIKGSDATNPLCDVSGQPTCGSLLSGQNVFALKALRISKVGESTNLLKNFEPQINTYTLRVTPDVTALEFVPQLFRDDAVVKLNGAVIGNSTTTEISFAAMEYETKITITLMSNDLEYTYDITVYQVGLCNTTDIDEDGDGLIEICWPLGLNAMRLQLNGYGYKVDTDIPIITDGCDYRNSGRCRGYELGSDLDLIGSNFQKSRTDWEPIGNDRAPFTAIFDGNGHTIFNLKIVRLGGEYIGLFGYAQNSTIANVGLADIDIRGKRYVGGLVGQNEGNIANSHATGRMVEEISSAISDMGGLVGINVGTIVNSYADVDVMGTHDNIGGLVGRHSGGKIKNSYATGTVSGRNHIGGFVGNQSGGTIENAYSTSVVTGSGNNIGGLVGNQNDSGVDIDDSYWDTERSGIASGSGEYAKTTVELQRTVIGKGIYREWSKNDWFSGSSRDYPIIKYTEFDGTNPLCDLSGQPSCGSLLGGQQTLALKTFAISTSEGEANFVENFVPEVTTHTIIVTADVTALDIALSPFNDVGIMINGRETTGTTQIQLLSAKSVVSISLAMQGLMHTYDVTVHKVGLCSTENIDEDGDGLIEICSPIGLDAIRHQLNGYGYKIDAITTPTIMRGCDYRSSGRCRGYELMADLNIEDITDNWIPIGNDSNPFTAILEGNNHTISNLTITTSTRYVGLFGYARNSSITAIALSDVDIEGGDDVGGIIGANEGTIANSYIGGRVIGNSRVGGLIGLSRGDIFNSYAKAYVSGNSEIGGFIGEQNGGRILNSYADGTTTLGRGDNIGGFVGVQSGGTIKNAYATGAVDGDDYIGGFVGNQRTGEIGNGYATGRVTAVGGRIGGFGGDSVSISDSYWDIRRSGIATSVGGTSETTVELQRAIIGGEGGIYENWDTADWYSGTSNDYPILKYTNGENDALNLCDSDGRPACDTILDDQLAPLNVLILQSGSGSEFMDEMLNPPFDPKTREYRITINPDATHIRFVLAAPTTRHISYRINDEDPIEIENSIATELVALPSSPIPLEASKIKKIVIQVASSDIESNREVASYTMTIQNLIMFVQLRLLLEGNLQ